MSSMTVDILEAKYVQETERAFLQIEFQMEFEKESRSLSRKQRDVFLQALNQNLTAMSYGDNLKWQVQDPGELNALVYVQLGFLRLLQVSSDAVQAELRTLMAQVYAAYRTASQWHLPVVTDLTDAAKALMTG